MALLNVILIQQVSHEDYHDVFFLSVFQMLTIGLVNPYPPTSCSNQRKADSRVTLFYKKSKAKTGNVIFPFQKAQNHCCSSKIVESIRFFNCGFCLQSITKKPVPLDFQPYVFPVYLRNRLTYKKSIYIFLYQFLKSSPLEQEFSKFDDKIS